MFFLLLPNPYSGHNQQSDYSAIFLVNAGFFSRVSVIYRTPKRTTGPFMCRTVWSFLRVRIHAGDGHTDKESAQHFRLKLNTKLFLVLLTGFEPRVIEPWVRRSNNLSTGCFHMMSSKVANRPFSFPSRQTLSEQFTPCSFTCCTCGVHRVWVKCRAWQCSVGSPAIWERLARLVGSVQCCGQVSGLTRQCWVG